MSLNNGTKKDLLRGMGDYITQAILVVLVIWVISAVLYARTNDYARELQTILLPVLGTVLLQFFITAKFIIVDTPKDPDIVKGTIAILSSDDHQFFGLGISEADMKKYLNRQGIKRINQIVWKQEFLDVNRELISSLFPSEGNMIALLNCIEYAVLDWMKEINQIQESWFNEEYIYLFPNGYSESALPRTDRYMITETTITSTSMKGNPLFNLAPLEIKLPSGANVFRVKSDGAFEKEFEIITNHSTINFKLGMIGSGRVSESNLPTNIISSTSTTGKNFLEYNFYFTASQRLNKWNCYSKEGKLHPEWFKLLMEKFSEAFSYESFFEINNS